MLRLNLGCCDRFQPDFVNVDRVALPGVDLVWDLNQRWPWHDSSCSEIIAYDIIEHLDRPIHTMNEAHRVLAAGGVLHIEVPTTEGRGAWQDPTHVSFWNENSFLYYELGAPENIRFAVPYGITAKFRTISKKELRFDDKVVKLRIDLQAIK